MHHSSYYCCSVAQTLQSLSRIQLFATTWTATHQASLFFITSQSLRKLISIESVMPSNYFILFRPLLLLPSIFPSIRIFSNELAFCIKIAKVLELQLQHQSFKWIFSIDFLQDWLVWSSHSPTNSQESSPTPQFKSINSSVLSFLYTPTLTSIHDYWKKHSFD